MSPDTQTLKNDFTRFKDDNEQSNLIWTLFPKRKYILLLSWVLKTEVDQVESRGCTTSNIELFKLGQAPYFSSRPPEFWVLGFDTSVNFLLVPTVELGPKKGSLSVWRRLKILRNVRRRLGNDTVSVGLKCSVKCWVTNAECWCRATLILGWMSVTDGKNGPVSGVGNTPFMGPRASTL